MKPRTNSHARDVARRLEEEILKGARLPGERLDERSLAEHFGVSRTPVREALQWLAANGLVTLRGRQGASVAELSVPDLLDAFYVIAELEGMAARQAARRMRPESRQRLEQSHRACAARAEAKDHEGFYEENLRFHDIIIESCQNRVLQDQIRSVRALTGPYRRYVTFQPGRMEASIPEHEAIMQAIFTGRGEDACRLMRLHVNLLGEGLSDLLRMLPELRRKQAS
jgi:DNA-binding GntR family transcriptional regulator